jgi:hypothetical protein
MKKIVSLMLALVTLFSLAACGGGKFQTGTTGSEQTSNTGTQASTSSEPKYGGSLTLKFDNFNTVFDPAMGENNCYDLWAEHLWCMNWGLNDPSKCAFKENVMTME